jgi:hypothetical protein
MIAEIAQRYGPQIQTIYFLFLCVNAILHVIFAGAIAKDAGGLYKIGQRPALVSALTWAFATLVGGTIVAAIYWFIHHSNLTRPTLKTGAHELT